ncbi:MAG: hypothetical protein ACRETH_08840 [Steroidobacteraceae bacterium]
MTVGGFRGFLELVIDLVEQVLGLLRMAAHIEFVSLLGGDDFSQA